MIIQKEKINKAARVLTDAFSRYIFFTSIIPDEKQRKEILPHLFRFLIKYGIKYGEVHVPSPNIEGVAIWLPSDKIKISNFSSLLCGGIPLFFSMNKETRNRFDIVEEAMQKKHFELMKEKHMYLSMMGIDNTLQGKGHGKAVIKEMLDRCAANKTPIYLETQTEENVKIYKSYGFKVKDEYLLPEIDIKCYAMAFDPSVDLKRN